MGGARRAKFLEEAFRGRRLFDFGAAQNFMGRACADGAAMGFKGRGISRDLTPRDLSGKGFKRQGI
jgi:hypothetical protein